MSAATQTKIFGVRIGVDPKLLIGGLIALAALLFWYNSRGDDTGSSAAPQTRVENAPNSTPVARPRAASRRTRAASDRGVLRLRPVDATRGDLDPTLRLDLWDRLKAAGREAGGRNLFELGRSPQTAANVPVIKGPIINPGPVTPPQNVPVVNAAPTSNIPLKYYGFMRPMEQGEANRGMFLDGDNVLIASEGDLVKQRYMVVEINPNSARLEDVQIKQGQVLPVVPAALPQ
jgi:hypothetical protein